MRFPFFRSVILTAAVFLGGCAASSYCTGEFDYQKARSLPPLEPVDGLTVPRSQSALVIPPAPEKPLPYALPPEGEEKRVRCLDMPPPMPESPAKS